MRGGRALPIKAIVDEAIGMGGCEAIRNVVVYRRTGNAVGMQAGRDVWMHDLVAKQADTCAPEWVDAEHPLFILYTSGSTGKPKGVQHSTGGYLLWAMLTMKWTFDIKPQDVFWCTADIGWVTGHTYIAYGPLATGATEVVFEGVPTYPNAGRFWETIQKHKVTVFYTAPTAIRSLIKAADADANVHPTRYDLSSLRLLGTVGEPINPEAWMWYRTNVGGDRCPIVDTFWQTETGGHMITPLPGVTATTPGSCTLPLPGIMAAIVDEAGHDVPNGQGGMLVIKRPWPAMIRTIWGDPERYKKSYYPAELGGKLYLAGDGSVRDKDDRLLHDHGADRRRAERLGPSPRNDGGRVRAGRESDRRGGRGRRATGRPDRRGDLRVRRAEACAAERRRSGEAREGAARLGRQGDRADREAQGHPLRRQPAEDALRQDHAPAAALDRQGRGRSRRTRPRSRTRRSSSSSSRRCSCRGRTRPIAYEKRGARRCRAKGRVDVWCRLCAVLPVNDIGTTLFALRLVKAVVEIALLALVGQGIVWVLIRAAGQPPEQNFFYRTLQTIAMPVTRPLRWITPKFVSDRHIPWAALGLLIVGWAWVFLAILNTCAGAGLTAAECAQR